MTEKPILVKLRSLLYQALHPWEKEVWCSKDSKLKKYGIYTGFWIATLGTVPSFSLALDIVKFFWKRYKVAPINKHNNSSTKKSDTIYNTLKKNIDPIIKLKKEATENFNKIAKEAEKEAQKINAKLLEDIKIVCKKMAQELLNQNDELFLNTIKNSSVETLFAKIEKKREEKAAELKLKIANKKSELILGLKKVPQGLVSCVQEIIEADLNKHSLKLENVGRMVNISLTDLESSIKKEEKLLEETINEIVSTISGSKKDFEDVLKKYFPHSSEKEKIINKLKDLEKAPSHILEVITEVKVKIENKKEMKILSLKKSLSKKKQEIEKIIFDQEDHKIALKGKVKNISKFLKKEIHEMTIEKLIKHENFLKKNLDELKNYAIQRYEKKKK